MRSFGWRLTTLISALWFAGVACGTSASTPPDSDAGAGGAGTGGQPGIGGGAAGGDAEGGSGGAVSQGPGPIDLQPCPVMSEGPGDDASCAEIPVPATWSDLDGPYIELFLKRIGRQEATRQLWMLNGGPGAAGSDFEPIAEYLVSLDDELSIFLLDHRGTGRSTRLGCPTEEADDSPGGLAILDDEWPGCIAYVEATFGPVLPYFNTTEAAGDVGWLIDQTRGLAQEATVWGGSYGTLWAQRYLQLFPDQADAISMLGIAHPEIGFENYDADYDQVGLSFLGECSADPFCSSKMGPDAAGHAQAILDAFEAGHCPEVAAAGLDRASLQRLFAYWLLWSWEERALVPAILYRLDRCSAGDVAALSFLADVLEQPFEPTLSDRHHSSVLANHISLSELWDDGAVTLEAMQGIVADSVFSLALGPRFAPLYDVWPRYEPDALSGLLAPTDLPMLLLQGQYDPATPTIYADQVSAVYTGDHQPYVLVPGGPHNWASPTQSGTECALAMFFYFVQSPTEPLYDCIGDVLPLDFEGSPALAAYLNTFDMWEDPVPLAAADLAPAPPPPPAALARDLWNARYRHRLR
jgi:pimeloyl-ACP methyl ester carboxylesterase